MTDHNYKFSNEKSGLENMIRIQKNKIVDLENKIILFLIEIERLGCIAFDREKEIDTWKQKYSALEINHDSQSEDLKIQFEQMLKTRIVKKNFLGENF